MSWIAPPEYNPEDICPICHERYGITTGIYKTECNHIFHNNCLNEWCERTTDTECPICRKKLEYSCTDVWAFKEGAMENSDDRPLFDGNRHILDIYNNGNKLPQGGGIRKRAKKTKRRVIKKRISTKNTSKKTSKKTKYRKRK